MPQRQFWIKTPAVALLVFAMVSAMMLATSSVAFAVDKIKIVKTAADPVIAAGDVASFTIVVSTFGFPVDDVTLNDPLPPGVSWSHSGPDAGSCSIVANVLSCSFGQIEAGGTRTVTISGSTTEANCGQLVNTARVNSPEVAQETETEQLDNSSTATITVECAPPPPPSSKITPTGTTCEQFRDGTATDLNAILYGVRANGTIGNVAPGIAFYFVAWNGGTIHIVQSDNGSTPAFGVQSVQVYTASNCERTRGVTISTVGTTTTISGATPGTAYIARLAMDPNTVVGSPAPIPATVTYGYTTTEVAGSTDTIALAPKP
ncbi:MAG: DUF11 domain-containing protein [Candidatus Limnocylindria bacterium]